MKKVKCKLCGYEHEVDSTGWVQSCLGYYPGSFMELSPEGMTEMSEAWGKKQ